MRWTVVVRRLLTGWSFALASLAILALFPRMEFSLYDQLIIFYREIPLALRARFPSLNRGYMGLHRSITLLGDPTGVSTDQVKVLELLRQDFAAAACWVSNQGEKLPEELNRPDSDCLVYAVNSQPRWDGKSSNPPPLILKQSEADSIVREVYLALKGPNGLIPCLPLVLYSRFLDQISCEPQVHGGKLILADRQIPVAEDEQGYTFPIIPYQSQVRAQTDFNQDVNVNSVTDPLEPIHIQDALKFPQLYFGAKVRNRFYFMGDFSMTALGEHVTSMGPFRDFQIAAISLDTLIQGPYLRWVSGWQSHLFNLLVATGLALWMLAPTTAFGRLLRAAMALAGCFVYAGGCFVAGLYFPMAWVFLYIIILNSWIMVRIWWSTLAYLRRYGGATAAHMLATGQVHLDHGVAEERTVTIVFIGLPAHLRQQELEDAPLTLEHRQIFSKRVADVTHRQNGIVHDFQADYLMLGFGTHPGEPDPNHAIKAFRAGNELIASREFFQEAWHCDAAGARVQVSLNTGLVAVGWVGTSQLKRASAAIGDTTNVAARLLGTAKKLDVNMILSESAYHFVQDQAQFEPLPPVMLKGKSEAVAIYKMVITE
ncbi:MAG: adenylate/guanylate cyclase domain-containing protein [Vulcanimicrobiota bacterium]